jgi:hypothetical protein
MRGIAAVMGFLTVAGVAQANTLPPTATSVRPSLVGTWSFDGSCASGDGMRLQRDGKASYDEWGQGLWALSTYDNHIVIIAEDITEEADRRQEAEFIALRIVARQGNAMTLVRVSDGARLNAVRCVAK